jgi:xanthine dehydrogenase accessory factor
MKRIGFLKKIKIETWNKNIKEDLLIFKKISELANQEKQGALATVIGVKGSTPRKIGTRMLVLSDGTMMGSICGGCIEAEVYQEARQIMFNGVSKVLEFKLNEAEMGEESGLICGGSIKIFIEPV